MLDCTQGTVGKVPAIYRVMCFVEGSASVLWQKGKRRANNLLKGNPALRSRTLVQSSDAPRTLVDISNTVTSQHDIVYEHSSAPVLPHLCLPSGHAERFRQIRMLGSGGTGTVYTAYDVELDRPVALKALERPPSGMPPHLFAQREARAVAALHHPGIVTLYDWISDSNTAWLVLEYVPGHSLAELLRVRGRFPAQEAVDICIQVCLALQYAHDRGVWHLDIKPGNILCAGHTVKITDFGIAERLTPGTDSGGMGVQSPGGAGRGWGTPGFASPEQLLGKPSAQSDVYAVGALLWALLTGDGSQGAATAVDLGAWRTIPRALRPVLRKTLASRPSDRPPTPSALANELAKTLDEGKHIKGIAERSWDALLGGLWAGSVFGLISRNLPMISVSTERSAWIVPALTALAAYRLALSVQLSLLALTVVLIVALPTLGVMLAVTYPLLVALVKLRPRAWALVFMAPMFHGVGLTAAYPILTGALLDGLEAGWIGAAGLLLAFSVQALTGSSPVQSYLSAAATALPPSSLISQIVIVILQISPRDVVSVLLPAMWQGASAPPALWSALGAAIAAIGISRMKRRLPGLRLAGMVVMLYAAQEGLRLMLGGSADGKSLVIGLALAVVLLEGSPERVTGNWNALTSWIRKRFSRTSSS